MYLSQFAANPFSFCISQGFLVVIFLQSTTITLWSIVDINKIALHVQFNLIIQLTVLSTKSLSQTMAFNLNPPITSTQGLPDLYIDLIIYFRAYEQDRTVKKEKPDKWVPQFPLKSVQDPMRAIFFREVFYCAQPR